MSTATHLAALDDIQDSLKWLRETLAGLPVEALDWVPAQDANSITVLVRHALPSTVFWVRAGSGQGPSHRVYVENYRTAAFESRGETAEALTSLIDQTEEEAAAAAAGGTDQHLRAMYSHDDEPEEPPITGAQCLVHAAAHLREHAGQVALTRQLWLALTPRPPLHLRGEGE